MVLAHARGVALSREGVRQLAAEPIRVVDVGKPLVQLPSMTKRGILTTSLMMVPIALGPGVVFS